MSSVCNLHPDTRGWNWPLIWAHLLSSMEKTMAIHSSTLAWKIPWTGEPGRLQFMGLRKVRHNWVTSLSLFPFMHWRRKWQPTPVFLPGESQGWGSLVDCHLWGCTELDTTEVTQQQQQQLSSNVEREEPCKQTLLACVGRAYSKNSSVDGPHWICHSPRQCAHPWSKLLSLLGVPWGHSPRWAMYLIWRAGLRLWHSWLIWTIQDPRKVRLATGCLLTALWEMQSLEQRFQRPLFFCLWLSLTCLSAYGYAVSDCWLALLWYLLRHDPLFCEHARGHSAALEPSSGKGPLFVSLVFPWFELFCHISALRAFNSVPYPKDWCSLCPHTHPPLAVGRCECVSQFSAGNQCSARILWWFIYFLVTLPSEIPKLPTDLTCERVSYCVETSPPSWLPPQDGSLSPNYLSFFLSLSFILPHFEEIGLPFWASGVLHQSSEIVWGDFLHMQVIFWCIFGVESGLLILFLCNLATVQY